MIPDIPISSGVYKITYSNGVTQYKHLISMDDITKHITPLKDEQVRLSKLPMSNNVRKQLDDIQFQLKQLMGDHKFLEGSPLFDAIETGELVLPNVQGGVHNVIIELVR